MPSARPTWALLSLFSMGAPLGTRKTSGCFKEPEKPKEKPCPKGALCFSWPKIGVWKSKMAMCEIPEGGEVATQTKFGKRLLQSMVAVASAFLGVTLLPFK